MNKIKFINVVEAECQPELNEKVNQWYNETHFPMLFKFEGVKRVTRYKRIGDGARPQYIAVFEFEDKETFDKFMNSPERAVALEDLKSTWNEGEFTVKAMTQYEFIRSWER